MATVDIFNMADTWNAIGTTFNGIYMNFTDGAGGVPVGAAASRFLRLDSDGTSVFDVAASGDTSLASSAFLAWSTDLKLFRDAANTLAQRNGTNAQRLAIYNTFTSATNRELFAIDWAASANICNLWTEKGSGGGTARALQLGTDGTGRWQIGATTGYLLAVVDNTYDIGASGATRPRTIYAGTNVVAGADVVATGFLIGSNIRADSTGAFFWSGRSALTSGADGNILLSNLAITDFGLLQFGGTTSSFPALKRSSAILQVRLADDSAFALIQGTYKHSANAAADAVLVSTHSIQIQDAAGNTYKVMLVSV